ncbi:MAG TPA: hemolysin family protein [Lacipirellulaceae bacterium]|nr:hemolysin family protein [Lacipirellulaceae bacterium]
MSTVILLWISIVSLLAACLTAIAARSLHSFSRHELEEICERSRTPDRFSEIILHHESVALGAEMVVMVVVAFAIGAASWWTWLRFSSAQSQPWLTFVVAMIVLGQIIGIAVVWLPWSVARIGAARFLYATWPLWLFVGRLARPLVWSAHTVDTLLHRVSGSGMRRPDEESIEEEIRTIVSEGHREGLLEEEAREMIEGVIELGDAAVSHIMTPRTEIHMVQINTPWEEVIESVIESGHTRTPVYDKTRDDIAGILYSKDLLPELAKSRGEPVRTLTDLLRKPLFVPETKPVDDLLKLFQKTRTHIAVVLDEYGGVSGLVSIEDVLEEIVGEIDDEYDQQSEVAIRKIDDDVCEALGRTHIDEINELMDYDLPEDADFDTIGGFVFAEFGRVPAVGESITWHDSLRVIVLEATRRRINRVRLERIRMQSLEAV